MQADIELLELFTVTDLYSDGSTFYRTLEAGNSGSTASPFGDCIATIMLKIEVDGHTYYDNFESGQSLKYDLEHYQLPAVVRRILKQQKLNDVVLITTTNKHKLFDHLEDEHGVFIHEKLLFNKEVKITVKLLLIEQKPHLFKIFIEEKVERLISFEKVSKQFRLQENPDIYF